MKQRIHFIIIIFFIVSVSYSTLNYVAAIEEVKNDLQITQNFQKFVSLKKFSQVTRLYEKNILTFEIVSSKNIELIRKGSHLVFWYPIDIKSGTGEIIASLGEDSITLPFELNISKDDEDYSIAHDMFKLSLQEKALSCESSAASDIISSFLGKNINEESIIKDLPKGKYYNTLPEKHSKGVTIWGNPNVGFVGYIDDFEDIIAKQKNMTGYGVYEEPISQIYKKRGFQTQIMNRWNHTERLNAPVHLRYLLEKLKRGSMVQLWGDWCTDIEFDDGVLESKNDFFNTHIGLSINAKNTCYNINEKRELTWKYYGKNGKLENHVGLDGEHAFILLGWKGSIIKPSHIRVWDTNTGYHLYPITEWMRKWERMDYRSIVISKKSNF